MLKYAIITGAASGIGLSIARILASKGYNLYIVDINKEGLEKLKTELENDFTIHVIINSIDLSALTAAETIFNDCCQKNLDIEVLINNAGFFFFSEVPKADPVKAGKMIQVHINTASMLSIYFSKQMKEKRKGYIMMTSSISAYKDFPGIGFYAASKSYIKSFCRSMHYEMRFYGVHVTALCPGATATNLYDPNIINIERGKRLGIMLSAEKVAKAGIKGLFKNKPFVIPGFVTKLITFLSIITPSWIIYLARKKYNRFF